MKTQNQKNVSPETIEALKAGDQKALKTVFVKYYNRLFHFVFSYTKCRYACEEVVQKVFIKVWEKREGIIPQTFGTYMFTIARNLAYNHMRDTMKRQDKERLWERIAFVTNEGEDHLICKEIRSAIDGAINQLPPKKRAIYILSRKKGKSNKEIARELHISPKTVKNHIWAINGIVREHMRSFLEKSVY
ncbi:RNA polymerase sigma-70 factor [Sinomicrobium kalidii]|uniref:RNA polymerase sigma factor n=1 Tax=Sinomicrobium kalidii TaxID=2900738 RepID=UPI001E2C26AC|nr:RNA polymerase sigma-70 factor [Sinomicrobium kalidii]UGU17506.1 RNA polymerase sigma-70 factor [Sinomicrobium kalidii]